MQRCDGTFACDIRLCGKWIGAVEESDDAKVAEMATRTAALGVPHRFVTQREAMEREPQVRMRTILESPQTGIVDVARMGEWLEALIDREDEKYHSFVARRAQVTRIEDRGQRQGEGPFAIFLDGEDNVQPALVADVLINSAGLDALKVSEMIFSSPPRAAGDGVSKMTSSCGAANHSVACHRRVRDDHRRRVHETHCMHRCKGRYARYQAVTPRLECPIAL